MSEKHSVSVTKRVHIGNAVLANNTGMRWRISLYMRPLRATNAVIEIHSDCSSGDMPQLETVALNASKVALFANKIAEWGNVPRSYYAIYDLLIDVEG